MKKHQRIFVMITGDALGGSANASCTKTEREMYGRRKLSGIFGLITVVMLSAFFCGDVSADIRERYTMRGDALQVEEITGELLEEGFYYTGLGSAIARNGDRMIVSGGKDFSVHIFERVNGVWGNDADLGRFNAWEDNADLAADYTYYQTLLYGNAVGIVGDYAAVGIPNQVDPNPALLLTGAVKIYARNVGTGKWAEEQVILGSSHTGASDCRFGYSVAMGLTNVNVSATVPTLVVGAFRKAVGNRTVAGTVYIYQRTGSGVAPWVLNHTWTAPSPANNGFFGRAVAISGNRVVASETGFSGKRGAVYVKTRNTNGTWPTAVETLPRPAIFQSGDAFGQVVDVDGDVVIVGHVDDVATGKSAVKKRAYVFKRENNVWVSKGEFKPMFTREVTNANITPAEGNDQGYGASVSVAGNEAVVGTTSGTAYVLREMDGVWKTSELIYDKGSPAGINAVNLEGTPEGNEVTLGYSSLNKAVVFGKNEGLPNTMHTMLPENAVGSEKLGSAVSGDSFAFMAGAPGGKAVYISSRRDGVWGLPQKFNGAANSGFGVSVDVDGAASVAVAGADLADISGTDSGGASIYRRNPATGLWFGEATMGATGNFVKPPGLATNDRLGYAVAIEGNVAVFGAWGNDTGGNNRGCAFVYEYAGGSWVYKAMLQGDVAGDAFGKSVAIYDGVIAVGAPGADTSVANAGAIYIYTGAGAAWTRQAKLVQASAGASDSLGEKAISMFGDYVAAGSMTDTKGVNSGSLFIFKKSSTGWKNGSEYGRMNGNVAGAYFGAALGMDADRLVVGAPLENGRGVVYHYAWNDTGSGITATLMESYEGAGAGDQLGVSVSLCGGVYMFGANQVDGGVQADIGAVNIYSKEAPPAKGLVQWLDATQLAAGGPGALKNVYSPSGSVARFTVKGWYDASLSGNHLPENLSQTEASRPSYMANESGYDKIAFDGSQLLQSSALLPGNSNRTVVMVLKSGNTSSAATIVSEGNPAVLGAAFEVTPQVGLRVGSSSVKAWNKNLGDNFRLLAVMQGSGSSAGVKAFVDGEVLQTSGSDPAQSINVATTGYRVGASAGGVGGFTGDIAEVYVYNRALAKTELEELQRYVNDKWLNLRNASTRTPAVDRANPAMFRDGVTVFLSNELKYGNVGSDAANIVYTLVSLPTGGCTLKKADAALTNWTPLGVNETFTQKEIDDGRISITHPGGGSGNYVSFVYDVNSPVGSFEDQTCYVMVRTERPSRKMYIRTTDQHYYPKNEAMATPRFDYMWDADIRRIGRASEWVVAKNLPENPTQNPHRSTMMYQQNPNIRFILYNKATYVHSAPDVGIAEANRFEIAMIPAGELKQRLTSDLSDNVVYMKGTVINGVRASTVAGNYSLPKNASQVSYVYFIRIGNELMRVESVTVNAALNQVEIGVTRGFDGTTPAVHEVTYTDNSVVPATVTATKISRPYFTSGGGPGDGTGFIAYWITGNNGVFNYNVELVKQLIDTKFYHGVYWDNYTAAPGGRWSYDNPFKPVAYTDSTYAKMQDERIGFVQSRMDAYIAGLSTANKPQFTQPGQTRPDEVFNVVNNMHYYNYMKIYGETMNTPGSGSEKTRPVDYIQYENWEREDRFLGFLQSEHDNIATLARTEIFGAEWDDQRYNKELYCFGWYLLCKNPASNSLFGLYGRRPNSWSTASLKRTITVHNQIYVNLGDDVNYPSSNPPQYFGDLIERYKVMKDGSPFAHGIVMAREFENAIVVVNRSSNEVQGIPLSEISSSYSGPYLDAVTGKGMVQEINLKPYSSMVLLKP